MAKVIDLGNGYGRIEGYPSEYANLTFPLTRSKILKLYALGVLNGDETTHVLLKMGYEFSTVRWSKAIAALTTEQWRKAIERAGTI